MAVVALDQVLGMIIGHLSVPAIALAPPGQDRPDRISSKMYVPTVAASSIGDQDPIGNKVLAPVEVGEWALTEVWRLVSAVVRDLAGWECGEWADVEKPVLVPAEGRDGSSVEAGDIPLAPDADSAVVGGTHRDKVAVRILAADADMVEAIRRVSAPVEVLEKNAAKDPIANRNDTAEAVDAARDKAPVLVRAAAVLDLVGVVADPGLVRVAADLVLAHAEARRPTQHLKPANRI